MVGPDDFYKHAGIFSGHKRNPGCGPHTANDDVSLCVVQAKCSPHRVEAAPDADQAATVSEGIDRLLNVGELSMTIHAVADGNCAAIAIPGGPMMAAIGDGGSLNGVSPMNKGQAAEMVKDAARRRILQNLNGTVGGPGGEAPIVGDLEIATGRVEAEGYPDSILNINRPRNHVEQTIRIDVLGLIPSRHAGVARGVRGIEVENTRNGWSESENAVGFVDRGDLRHVSGQTLELAEVVSDLDPVSNLESQDAVAPDLLHCDLRCNRNR